jgi:hypothetical protein
LHEIVVVPDARCRRQQDVHTQTVQHQAGEIVLIL